jgi:hypothetical protein
VAGLDGVPARGAQVRLGRLIEITTQPLLEMLAEDASTPPDGDVGPAGRGQKWAHRNAIIAEMIAFGVSCLRVLVGCPVV